MGITLGTASALVALSTAVSAQTVDYGTLEQIFGQPVTTSATGTPKLASDAPATMEIITQEQIRRSGGADIPEILRQLAGIDIWRYGVAGVDVNVRGYNQPYAPRLLVLVNGRQVYLDHYGMTNWNAIPVEMGEIRQIEVVKGPNAALFGFNAVSGVVNIITFSPLHDDVDTATVRVGTQKHRQLSVVQTFKPSDEAGVRLSLGGFNADEFDTAFDRPELSQYSQPFRIDPSRRSASLDSLFQVTDNGQLGVELTHTRTRDAEFSVTADLARAEYEISSAKVSYTADTEAGLIEAMAYHNRLDVNLLSPSLRDYNLHNRVSVAKLQDVFRVNSAHSLRLTGEARYNTMNTLPTQGADVNYAVYSGGGMWDWAIADGVTLTNAARIDKWQLSRDGEPQVRFPLATVPTPFDDEDFERDYIGLNINSGLVIKPTNVDTVRLTYARGLQLPSQFMMGFLEESSVPARYGLPFDYVIYMGNPTLTPTTVTNYEVSWDRALPSLDADMRLSVFHQIHENLMSPIGSNPSGLRGNIADFTDENVGNSRAWGGEIGLAGKIGPVWRWGINYTYEIVNDDFTVNQRGASYPLLFEGGTPRHRVNGHLGYTNGPWEADLFAHYLTGFQALRWPSRGNPLDDYEAAEVSSHLVMNGRLAYRLNDSLTVALEGVGINQADHDESASAPTERRLFLSLTGKF